MAVSAEAFAAVVGPGSDAGQEDFISALPLCFTNPSFISIFLACFLMVGTIVSYVPQYVAIIRARSSEGLSFLMLGLSLESSCLTAINSGILWWGSVTCCAEISVGECLLNNLPTEQLTVSLLCYLVLFVLYLFYFRVDPTPNETMHERMRERRKAYLVFAGVLISSIALSVVAGVLYYNLNYSPKTLGYFAMGLGIISAVCMILMWAPQIVETWRRQDQGQLSSIMLLLQLPGALLVVVFQGVVNQASWTTWVPYVFGFIQMFVLLMILIWLWFKKRRQRREEGSASSDDASVDVPTERSALLQHTSGELSAGNGSG
jgi:uncharacterized protein with PQ loop repeat